MKTKQEIIDHRDELLKQLFNVDQDDERVDDIELGLQTEIEMLEWVLS